MKRIILKQLQGLLQNHASLMAEHKALSGQMPTTLEDLEHVSLYSFDIDVNATCEAYFGNYLGALEYGIISTYGNNLTELLDNATVDIITQDGEEFNVVSVDEPWMLKLIEAHYIKAVAKGAQ